MIINVPTHDSDIDNSTGANGSSLLPANAGLTVRLVSQPAHGQLTLHVDGSQIYVPSANWSRVK